jgi:UrcA family protein
MKIYKRSSLVTIAALVVALGMPAIGSAALGGAEQYEVSVGFSDLDLSQDKGVSTLYARLRSAASRACGPTSIAELGSIERVVENKQCFNSLMDKAVAQINDDKLTTIHNS